MFWARPSFRWAFPCGPGLHYSHFIVVKKTTKKVLKHTVQSLTRIELIKKDISEKQDPLKIKQFNFE